MTKVKDQGLRVDRWLWYTRFYRTRTLASDAVHAGHVRIDGERAKPGSRLMPGAMVEIVKDQLRYKLHVLQLPARRGPAAEARECYEEDAAIQQARQEMMTRLREDRRQMPRTRGKPDKHTRRMLRERNRGRPDGSG